MSGTSREWFLFRQPIVWSSWLQQRASFCLAVSIFFAILTSPQVAWEQLPKAAVPKPAEPSEPKTPTPASEDPLSRTTPRGTVLGFLSAAYNQKYDLAAQYLDTHTNEKDAITLARQLFFVL